MKRSIQRFAITSLALMSFVVAGYGQSAEPINVVTTAVPFLRISPDARAGGMGDVGTATSADANSQFYNVAKYPFNKNPGGISLTYTPWLKDLGLTDVYLASLAGYYKLDDQQVISASLRYFSLGNIQFTDALGNDLNSFRPRELGVDVGYSRKLSDVLSLGVALRYINSNLAGGAAVNGVSYKAGNAVAGDIGLFYQKYNESGQGWNFGVAMTNLGSKIGYTDDATQKDYLPANFSIGAGHTWVFNEVNKFTMNLEINKLMVPTPPTSTGDYSKDSAAIADYRSKGVVGSWFSSFADGDDLKELAFSFGAEYWYNDQFAVRGGYYYEDKSKGNRKYFTMGVGLKYNMLGLNFSYLIPSGNGVNRNPLSNTLRFSLIFDINGAENSSSK
ncbi:MAG: hypothetical protein C5B52_06890 [Bacteroidetes bacterium]|nr:MAG: hypothetical protein C5B52_06890 [Bacteroidota bacterium]